MKTIHLFLLKKTFKSPAGRNRGMSFAEVLIVVVVIGILGAFIGPMWRENPLRAGTNQAGSLLRQVRMRAMANTTAYRVRPDPSSILPNTQLATRFLVQSASGRACGATTNVSPTVAPTPSGVSSIVPVTSITGFSPSDRVTIGSALTTYEITGINNANAQLVIGSLEPANSGNLLLDAEVSLASAWQNDPRITGILPEDLQLPTNINAGDTIAITNQITVNGNAVPWSLCFDAQGLANLYNANTGRIVNQDLQLEVLRCMTGTTCANINQRGNATITVNRGGGVAVPNTIN